MEGGRDVGLWSCFVFLQNLVFSSSVLLACLGGLAPGRIKRGPIFEDAIGQAQEMVHGRRHDLHFPFARRRPAGRFFLDDGVMGDGANGRKVHRFAQAFVAGAAEGAALE